MHRRIALLLALVVLAAPAGAEPWQGGGPELGWVTTLLRPFGPGGPLYAGTYGGGIWRSDDGGATWAEATSNARDAVVWDLAVGDDPRSSMYAATEDRGLLRSEDFSAQWFGANTGLGDFFLPAVFDIETFPLDPTRIVAATGTGARVSRTRGDAWADSLLVSGVQPVRAVAVLESLPRTVHYLGSGEIGIQRGSTEAPEVYTAGLASDTFLFDFAPWPEDTQRLVVADFDGAVWNFDGQVFKSLRADTGFVPAPKFYRIDVTDGGTGPVIRVAADRGLFTSVDEGETWNVTAQGRSTANPEVWSILVDDASTGALLLGGFVDGVVRAPAGGGAWVASNEGLRAAWVRAVDARDGEVLAGTAHGRLFSSIDGALTWTEVTGGLDDLQLTTVWRGDGSPWVVTAAGGVFFTEDQGGNWTAAGLPDGVTRLNDIVDAGPGRLVATSDAGLVESDDEGRTWSHVAGLAERRSCFAVGVFDGRIAVGFDPRPGVDGAVYVGDAGGTFAALPVDASIRPRGLAFFDNGDGLLVARLSDGSGNLVRVTGLIDGPVQLTAADSGPVGEFVEPVDLVPIPGSTRRLLATASHGVRSTDDGGVTWSPLNDGLVGLRTEDLAVDVSGGMVRLALGTFARGAWSRIVDDVVAVDDPPRDDVAPPRVTRVLPPAPNPFNPRTTIRWEQAADAEVAVDLYDLRGRRLRTLLTARLVAGTHRVTWDGTDAQGRAVASGTYLVRVRVGQRVHTARLTLVR